MSIRIAGEMAKAGRREGMEEAAKIAERQSNRIMRNAQRVHEWTTTEPPHKKPPPWHVLYRFAVFGCGLIAALIINHLVH